MKSTFLGCILLLSSTIALAQNSPNTPTALSGGVSNQGVSGCNPRPRQMFGLGEFLVDLLSAVSAVASL